MKKSRKFFKSIRGRLSIGVAIGVLLIVVLSAAVAIASIVSIQRSSSIQLVDSIAEAKAEETSAWLEGQKATIKELGVVLEATKNTDLHKGAAILHEAKDENPYALNYYYCSADAAVSEYGEDMELIPSERGWWIQAFEAGDTVIVDPYTDIATGKTIISACYPFYVDGKPYAVLADIDVTTVLEIINQIEEKPFCEGFLLSASGDVITHKNSEWLPADEGSTNLSEALHTDLNTAVTIRDYDGRMKFFAVKEIASTGWQLGVLESTEVIQTQVNGLVTMILILGAVFIVIAFTVVSVAIGRSLRPVGGMKDFVQDVILGGTVADYKNETMQIQYLVDALQDKFVHTIQPIDTTNILFICGGAFDGLEKIVEARMDASAIGFNAEVKSKSDINVGDAFKRALPQDFVKFGLIPEFIGRVPITVSLDSLDRDALIRILKEPKNSLIKQYTRLLELDGVGLEFEDSAIEAIADKALERKTGARGLRAIMEAVMLDLMYRVPSDDSISKCVVDKKMVENNLALDGEEILGIEQDPKKEVKEELAS